MLNHGTNAKSFSCGRRVEKGRACHLKGICGILTFNKPQVMDQQSKAHPPQPPLTFIFFIESATTSTEYALYWRVFPLMPTLNFLFVHGGWKTLGARGKVNVTQKRCPCVRLIKQPCEPHKKQIIKTDMPFFGLPPDRKTNPPVRIHI